MFIMLCKLVPILEPMDETVSVIIHIKAVGQYIPVVLFIMLYKVALTFQSED